MTYDKHSSGVCSCAVPAVLNETLPAAVTDVERELSACQRLAWQYTALLEKIIIRQDTDCPVPTHVLKRALYNTRQHEAFLKTVLVSCARHHITCSEELPR